MTCRLMCAKSRQNSLSDHDFGNIVYFDNVNSQLLLFSGLACVVAVHNFCVARLAQVRRGAGGLPEFKNIPSALPHENFSTSRLHCFFVSLSAILAPSLSFNQEQVSCPFINKPIQTLQVYSCAFSPSIDTASHHCPVNCILVCDLEFAPSQLQTLNAKLNLSL